MFCRSHGQRLTCYRFGQSFAPVPVSYSTLHQSMTLWYALAVYSTER